MSKNDYWSAWGGNPGQVDYSLMRYDRTPTYNNDGVYLHTLIFEDEDGKRIQTCFEAFKSYGADMPVVAIKLRSMVRCDSNEAIEVPNRLEEAIYGQALQSIAESDKQLLDEVPAW